MLYQHQTVVDYGAFLYQVLCLMTTNL